MADGIRFLGPVVDRHHAQEVRLPRVVVGLDDRTAALAERLLRLVERLVPADQTDRRADGG